MRVTAAAFAAGVLALLLAGSATSRTASLSPTGSSEIFSIAADGSDRVALTNSPGLNGSPAVSLSGKQVAFVSTREGYQEIYLMNADGSGQERVCPKASESAGPCVREDAGGAEIGDLRWAASGQALGVRVAFPGIAICYSPAAGNYLLDLTSHQIGEIDYGLLSPPLFSSDGQFVAWTFGGCQKLGPHVVVSGAAPYAGLRLSGAFVAWAPKGVRFLYEPGTSSQLATADPLGGHRWTLRGIPARAPVWSPSGRRIAFFRESNARRHGLYVVEPGTRRLRLLLRFRGLVTTAAWSPNGAWIAFGGPDGAYVVSWSGKDLRHLQGVTGLNTYSPLLWSSDSRHVAFVDDAGAVRVASPPERAAAAVTSATQDTRVCKLLQSIVPLCQIAWAGDRLLFAAG
jgi:Tol biopolymer transport system component